MKNIRGMLLCTLALLFILRICLLYAFQIEPYRIKVNEYSLNEKQSDQETIKIIQISDLHMKENFTDKQLRKVVEKINEQQPDLVIFTGDLYDNYATYHNDPQIISELQNVKAAYGKIAIWGNRDYGGGAVRQYAQIMQASGFHLLKNEHTYIHLENNKSILITGLDDALLGTPKMPAKQYKDEPIYRILLSHEPDLLEETENLDYHLALSGHSHGGQFNLPFLPFLNEKAVSATDLSTKYSGGMYTLNQETGLTLYVNTGIGTTHISARFGVVPEIAVFYLHI